MIKEINTIRINDKSSNKLTVPFSIWLESLNDVKQTSFKLIFEDSENVVLDLFSKSILTICNVEELEKFMSSYGISSHHLLRIEFRETNKWGLKPLFINGTNNICFQIFIKDLGSQKVIILYNTSGSHEIESIYLHGIWLI